MEAGAGAIRFSLGRGTTAEEIDAVAAGHDGGRRAGTESALHAAGLGAACRLARDLAPMDRVRASRDGLWQRLQADFGDGVA
jgi:cysteine desulfurase